MTFSSARESSKDSLLPEAAPVSYASLTFAVKPTFDTPGFAYQAQQPVEGRIERQFLAARPPQALAHRIDQMPVAMPVRLNRPAKNDTGLNSVHGRAVVTQHNRSLPNHPSGDVLELVSRGASAEGDMRTTLPKLTPEAPEQSRDSLVSGRL